MQSEQSENLSVSQSGSHQQLAQPPILAGQILAVSGLLASAALTLDLPLPQWLQPTCVGLLWGGLFSLGFSINSVGRGKLSMAAFSVALFTASVVALGQITDLRHPDCLLLSSCLVTAGWLVAYFDRRCLPDPAAKPDGWTLGIWDLGCWTGLAACFCHSLMQLSHPSMLLMAVLISLFAGLNVSWLASRWAWAERFSLRAFILCGLPIGLACAWLFWRAPVASPGSTLTWLLTGPLTVIAAQGSLVLLVLAVLRYESSMGLSHAPYART